MLLRLMVAVCFVLSGPSAALAGDVRSLSLATATPGGGFPLYGDAVAAAINSAQTAIRVETRNTKGSGENIGLLERGEADLAMIAGVPAYEALAGAGRPRSTIKIVAAVYATFGIFAVDARSKAADLAGLKGQRVVWGTASSGLTALAGLAMTALNLDRDRDFTAIYVEAAGRSPRLLAEAKADALWGGGIGWPGLEKAAGQGARLVGFSANEVQRITAARPDLRPYTVPPGTYPGQDRPLLTVASWSVIAARPDLPEEDGYRFARSLYAARDGLIATLPQIRETTPHNTKDAARQATWLHAGAARYLAEAGVE